MPPIQSVIHAISNVQFFQQLAAIEAITQADALAAVGRGVNPPALQRVVDAIADPAQQFAANMLLTGTATFRRDHPLTNAIGASLGMTAAQIDELFIAAAALRIGADLGRKMFARPTFAHQRPAVGMNLSASNP
jgi:hypothetical protein